MEEAGRDIVDEVVEGNFLTGFVPVIDPPHGGEDGMHGDEGVDGFEFAAGDTGLDDAHDSIFVILANLNKIVEVRLGEVSPFIVESGNGSEVFGGDEDMHVKERAEFFAGGSIAVFDVMEAMEKTAGVIEANLA